MTGVFRKSPAANPMATYLLDTSVLIVAINNKKGRRRLLASLIRAGQHPGLQPDPTGRKPKGSVQAGSNPMRGEQRAGPVARPHDDFQQISRNDCQLAHAKVVDDEQRHRGQHFHKLLARAGGTAPARLSGGT